MDSTHNRELLSEPSEVSKKELSIASLDASSVRSLDALKQFLDVVHINFCLVEPYFNTPDYPVVESRELLPSFESDVYEYSNLPGFSLVAFERPINYFHEIFQFDIVHNLVEQPSDASSILCPLEQTVMHQNLQIMLSRLPKHLHTAFNHTFASADITALEHYAELLPYLLQMDRGHVLAMDDFGNFSMVGVYASFPSDLDAEIKRYGLRIGKFKIGNNTVYERNRLFVYQFLMELYGFPIVSERRTSSALFARRLHKLGEKFLIRVLGQSDRTITTIYADPSSRMYPRVEKIALVKVEKEQKDIISRLEQGGYFVDPDNMVVILRVRYRQHKFNPNNVRQERALSVENQEILHPLHGTVLSGCNIIKDTYSMFLRLNDIVRGEYAGKIVYKRNEIVEDTASDKNRLKFLYYWLSKHQRRIIGYSDDFFDKIAKVLDSYLFTNDTNFNELSDLHNEVVGKYSYIAQARKVGKLEDLIQGRKKTKNSNYLTTMHNALELLQELQFDAVHYNKELVSQIIYLGEILLNDTYISRRYLKKSERELSSYGRKIRTAYGRLVSVVDAMKAIRKSRDDSLAALKKTG